MSNSAAWLDLSDAAREAVPPKPDGKPAEKGTRSVKGLSWGWMFLLLALTWVVWNFPLEIALWNQAAARQAILESDYPAAIEYLSQALDWQPDDLRLLSERSHLKLQAGDFTGAIEDATLALEATSELPEPMRSWPLTLRAYVRGAANRDIEAAWTDISEVFKLEGSNARLDPAKLHTRGLIEFRLGKLDAAWEDLTLATRLDEDHLGKKINEIKRKMHMEVDRRTSEMEIKSLQQNLASIYYHQIVTGQALAKRTKNPNLQKQIELELERSRQRMRKLGYDPAKEIW